MPGTALTPLDLFFPVSIQTPQLIPQGFSRLYGQAAVRLLLVAPTFLGDEPAAGQPPSPRSAVSSGCVDPSPGAVLSRCSVPATSRRQQPSIYHISTLQNFLQARSSVLYRRTADFFFTNTRLFDSASSRWFCHVVLEMTRSRWRGAWSRPHFPSGTVYF